MNYFSWASWWNSLIFNRLICPIWSLASKIELTNGINLFFACLNNFMKINLKVLGFGMVKNGCDQSCNETLKLTVSEEWTDGINWFYACWYRFTKIESLSKIFWLGIVKNRCGQSGHGTLKLAVSIAYWFFACWYKFRKPKSWHNDFWVDLIKNDCGLFVHETIKSACLKNECVNWVDFLIANNDTIVSS